MRIATVRNAILRARSLAVRRLWRGLKTFPDAGGWGVSALVSAAAVTLIGAISAMGGLAQPGPPELSSLPLRALTVLVIPALGEELAFRGLLVPDRTETARPFASLVLATVLFTGWHGVETLFLSHAAAIFLRPDFLACAAVLGFGCGLMRWRTASVWPGVLLHWAVVVVWQTWLGGPGIAALR